jgi:prephenate dehydrogenase
VKTPSGFDPQTIVISSVGLLGGSIGLSLKSSGFQGRIIGLSSPDNVEIAIKLGCIDEGYGYDSLEEVIKTADVIFLCSPIMAIIESIKKLGNLKLPQGLLVTDVGSTKQAIKAAAAEFLPKHVRFIGGHPMAGSEKSGPSVSDPYLFQNAIYVLTPEKSEPDTTEKGFAHFLESRLGCRHVFLAPDIHDRIAATVSHVPHLLAVALVNLAKRTDDRTPGALSLAAGGFRDLTRIASAPFSMWRDILTTNDKIIAPIIDEYIEILNEMKANLSAPGVGESFKSAATARNQIPSNRKGFISALHEVLVFTKDQPGIIARMAGALAAEDINIKDIEVMKIREGEGGTIRLGLESPQTAARAIGILEKHGFTARERK